MPAIPRDLRLAFRAIVARPALALVRVATLAVVVGAAGAVLIVANAALVRPLPYKDPDRLVRLFLQPPATTSFQQSNPLHPLEFLRFREARLASLEAVEGIWARERAVGGDGDPESVPSAAVSAGVFGLVGAAPTIGRTFTNEEAYGSRRVVVLSHGFWTRRFGASQAVLGRTVLIDREPHEIIGVMPEGFEPPFVRSEFWTPLEVRDGNLINPGATFIQTIGRLRPNATAEQAQAELEGMVTALTQEAGTRLIGWHAGVRDLRDAQYGAQTRPLLLLAAAVAALALIAIANLANLTLADILHRRAELAVRSALGAGRMALLWPEVLQSLVLAAAGGILGLGLSMASVPALVALDPANRLAQEALVADWRVMAAIAALAFTVIAAAAVLPAWRVAGKDVAVALAEGGQRTAGARGHERVRAWLVATQTALAMILVSSGALLATAFDRTARSHPGFDAAKVLTAQLRLAESAYPSEARRAEFVERVLERVRSIEGVVNASTTMNLFVPGFTFQTLVHIEGHPTADGQQHTVLFRRVSPGYFATLRIPEIAGRTFDSHDTLASQPVIVISRSFAERFWPGEDPIGKRVRRGTAPAWVTVIGLVGDVQDVGLGQAPEGILYLPYAQNNNVNAPVSLVVRTAGDPRNYAAAVKSAVWQVDPAQPLSSMATLEQFLADSLGPQRFRSVLLGVFGGVGLLLATVGIYAVTTRSIAERTREVGVRLALGGQPRHVWLTLARRTLTSFGVGLAAGLAGAAIAASVLASVFPEVGAVSALHAVPALLLLLGVGGGTALAATRRVTRIDPLRALGSRL
jgi:putative ABC transport system permease protein